MQPSTPCALSLSTSRRCDCPSCGGGGVVTSPRTTTLSCWHSLSFKPCYNHVALYRVNTRMASLETITLHHGTNIPRLWIDRSHPITMVGPSITNSAWMPRRGDGGSRSRPRPIFPTDCVRSPLVAPPLLRAAAALKRGVTSPRPSRPPARRARPRPLARHYGCV